MVKSKLYRNLKVGDKFEVYTDKSTGVNYHHTVTVSHVKKVYSRCYFGRYAYMIYGNFPFWWGRNYLQAESNE